MSLLDYIKGNRKGKEAHRLEKDAMRDPFLSEALEGFDSVDDDHIKQIKALQSRIANKSSARRAIPISRQLVWGLAAACIITLLITGGYKLIETPQTRSYAEQSSQAPTEIIEIYVPSNFYKSNKQTIAQRNMSIASYAKKKTDKTENDGESPINIYVPREYYEKNKDVLKKLENSNL